MNNVFSIDVQNKQFKKSFEDNFQKENIQQGLYIIMDDKGEVKINWFNMPAAERVYWLEKIKHDIFIESGVPAECIEY